jgi:valyl-tRNA synthetase
VADHHASLVAYQAQIAAIARLSEVRFVAALPDKDAPVSITAGAKVMLHVEIDRDAERARLTKETTRLEGEIAAASAMLGKASFVERAPPAVVEQKRKELADKETRLAALRAQLAKLG